MKRVLILVLSSQKPPYGEMIETSLNTWDSVEVEGVETIFYCGAPVKENTNKIIYFSIREDYANLGHKFLEALHWAKENKEFDYIARVNSSCYVDKKELIKHVQNITGDAYGLIVPASEHEPKWIWGGGQFILSKKAVDLILENKEKFNHSLMDDMAISRMLDSIGIEYSQGKACSIDKMEKAWRLMSYGGGDTFEFTDFNLLKNNGHFFYRVKQDGQRYIDKYLMNELFKVLNEKS